MRLSAPRVQPLQLPVEGGHLVGTRQGSGPPALLLHGGPAVDADSIGGALAEEMSAAFDVVRYSARSVPPSTSAGPAPTIDQQVEDAVAVLDDLGIEKAWLIAHSWGGFLALDIARLHPDRVAGIIDIGGLGAVGDGGGGEFQRVYAKRAAEFGPWAGYFGDPAKAVPPKDVRTGDGKPAQRTTIELFMSGAVERALPAMNMPVLFVHGTLDPMPINASARATAARMPDATVTPIAGVGHFPWLEQPGSVIDAYRGWEALRAPQAVAAAA